MKKVKISIIAAIGKNRELGKDNKLLWHIPEDLQHFKKLTENHVVIMGRKTFESIGKPLPHRLNIIITRDKSYSVPKSNDPARPAGGSNHRMVVVCSSLEEALRVSKFKIRNSKLSKEVFVIGGGQIYQQAIKYADKLYLTIVTPRLRQGFGGQADTFFPDYSDFRKIISEEKRELGGYKYKFVELEK